MAGRAIAPKYPEIISGSQSHNAGTTTDQKRMPIPSKKSIHMLKAMIWLYQEFVRALHATTITLLSVIPAAAFIAHGE